MSITEILTSTYFIAGMILAFYWFSRDYSREYRKDIENGNVEKGMVSIFLLCLVVLWPVNLIKNLVKRKTI
jgi:hypothetical protein